MYAATEGVMINDTSVKIILSWNVVIIPGFQIDKHTVVYSPVFGEMTAEFSPTATSCVITGLDLEISSKCLLVAKWSAPAGRKKPCHYYSIIIIIIVQNYYYCYLLNHKSEIESSELISVYSVKYLCIVKFVSQNQICVRIRL